MQLCKFEPTCFPDDGGAVHLGGDACTSQESISLSSLFLSRSMRTLFLTQSLSTEVQETLTDPVSGILAS